MRKKTFSEEQIALDLRDVGMGIAELRRLRRMEEETRHSIQITVDTYGHLVPEQTGKPSIGSTIFWKNRPNLHPRRTRHFSEQHPPRPRRQQMLNVMGEKMARPRGFEPLAT